MLGVTDVPDNGEKIARRCGHGEGWELAGAPMKQTAVPRGQDWKWQVSLPSAVPVKQFGEWVDVGPLSLWKLSRRLRKVGPSCWACLDLPETGDGHARFHVFEACQTRITTSDLTLPQNPRHVAGPSRPTHQKGSPVDGERQARKPSRSARTTSLSVSAVHLARFFCLLFWDILLSTNRGPPRAFTMAFDVPSFWKRSGQLVLLYVSSAAPEIRMRAFGESSAVCRPVRQQTAVHVASEPISAVQETAYNPAATRRTPDGKLLENSQIPAVTLEALCALPKYRNSMQSRYLRRILYGWH